MLSENAIKTPAQLEKKELRKFFNKKWKDFIEDEGGKYEINQIYYAKNTGKFFLRSYDRFIIIKMVNEELNKKLIKFCEKNNLIINMVKSK